MAKAIYKFYLYCGRMGELEGVFVADQDTLQHRLGLKIDYGECLGKNSEIMAVLDMEQLTLVTDNPDFIELFEKYDLAVGTNPLRKPYKQFNGDWVDAE